MAERRCCLEATLEIDSQRSTRYWGALVVQRVEHHEAELERDPLQYIELM